MSFNRIGLHTVIRIVIMINIEVKLVINNPRKLLTRFTNQKYLLTSSFWWSVDYKHTESLIRADYNNWSNNRLQKHWTDETKLKYRWQVNFDTSSHIDWRQPQQCDFLHVKAWALSPKNISISIKCPLFRIASLMKALIKLRQNA